MSIQANIDTLSEEWRKEIATKLKIQMIKNKSYTQNIIYPYSIQGDDIYLPLYYAIQKGLTPRKHPKCKLTFTGQLRDYQQEMMNQVFPTLKSQHTFLLSLHVGWGKSILSIAMACKLKRKTLIIAHRVILLTQWKETIEKECSDSKVQILTSKNPHIEPDTHFCIINASLIPKLGFSSFTSFGTIIADEVHLLCAQTLHKAFYHLTPEYAIGLSATPHRKDGLDQLIDFYFGVEKAVVELKQSHIVYPIHTGITIEHSYQSNGDIDWNSVLVQQSENEQRLELILSIVKKYPQRIFLILVKRVEQGKRILVRLEEEKESHTNLLGTKKEYDSNARILVASVQKAGVGFSHPRLDTLLLASDMESYFIQYLGRVFRTPDVKPIIFDLIDDHPVLKRHYYTRRKVYLEAGGVIEKWII